MIYEYRGKVVDSTEHLSGRACYEKGCDLPAGTPWTPYWCPAHDIERQERISRNLEAMVKKLDERAGVDSP